MPSEFSDWKQIFPVFVTLIFGSLGRTKISIIHESFKSYNVDALIWVLTFNNLKCFEIYSVGNIFNHLVHRPTAFMTHLKTFIHMNIGVIHFFCKVVKTHGIVSDIIQI